MPTFAVEEIRRERRAVLEEARSWLGTPFHHGARLKRVGVDCAQFLIACYVGLGIVEPFDPGFYSPDWFCHDDDERFRDWVARCCIATDHPAPGDLLLFRYGRASSHGAILVDDELVIHSYRGRGVVEEECGPGTPLAARFTSAWTPARWRRSERLPVDGLT